MAERRYGAVRAVLGDGETVTDVAARFGIARGQLDAGADFDVAASMMTGSWCAFALAGKAPPRDWADQVASLVWRSCGGSA